ncbi:hypothetical protein OIU77_031117 [Salix suchowensis]|uniref:Uncharacterized protein n=1 Tax=Salix suchowensis TaxID=1278906 RepID=A0ABQ9BEB1_9ROSI|nr:hypothetical protein OIU77_031117 [Salix suchowensis]
MRMFFGFLQGFAANFKGEEVRKEWLRVRRVICKHFNLKGIVLYHSFFFFEF